MIKWIHGLIIIISSFIIFHHLCTAIISTKRGFAKFHWLRSFLPCRTLRRRNELDCYKRRLITHCIMVRSIGKSGFRSFQSNTKSEKEFCRGFHLLKSFLTWISKFGSSDFPVKHIIWKRVLSRILKLKSFRTWISN